MEARKGGGGGVARLASSFVAAWCKPYHGITDPLIAEVLALQDCVIYAQLRGFPDVEMKIGCLSIVRVCLVDRVYPENLLPTENFGPSSVC
jgi:hypothetical protein